MRIQRWMGAALVVMGTAAVVAAGSVVTAAGPDDDLAVVKKATGAAGEKAARTASPAAAAVAARARAVETPPPPRDEPRADDLDAMEPPEPELERDTAPPTRMRRGSGREPRWFRVRVIEHGRKRGGVTINLPIGIARALGDDFPIELGCHRHHGRRGEPCPTLRLGDVLRSLASGEDLVAIDDDDTTVRVWVG